MDISPFARWIQRNPIVVRAIIVIVVVAALRIAVLVHFIPADWALSEDDAQAWIERAIAAFAAWRAIRKVTPVVAPRNDDGVPLIPSKIYPPGARQQ